MKNKFYLLLITFLFYSCSSITLREGLNVNEREDWLQNGKDGAKTNISGSNLNLKPPFKLLWNFSTDAAFARSVLSASDGVLFAGCLNGDVYAIDVKSGSKLGRTFTKSKSGSSAPLILKNTVILAFSDGLKNFISGYNFNSGEYQWKKVTEAIMSSPAEYNGRVYYSSTKGNIFEVESENGEINKIYKNKFSFWTSPSLYNGVLLIGDVKGNLLAIDISGGNLKWCFKTGGGIYSDASVYRDKIFFGSDDGNFYCLDTSGTLIWKKNLDTKFLSSASFYADYVICTGINGKIYSLEMKSGDIVWEYEAKGTITASPVLSGDKIFVGSYDRFFYCMDANNGMILWKYEFDERIKTSAIIWKNYIIVACDDKSIYCFK